MSSAFDTVWAIPFLRQNILSNLTIKQCIPLLTVNNTFFIFGVEKIYNYLYGEAFYYGQVVKTSKESTRREQYCNAVRTLYLRTSGSVAPHEWIRFFDLYPNATTINCGDDVLHRNFKDGDSQYQFIHEHEIFYDGEKPFMYPPNIQHCQTKNCLHQTEIRLSLTDVGRNAGSSSQIVSDLLQLCKSDPDAIITGISTDDELSSQSFLDYMQQSASSRMKIVLKLVESINLNQALLQIIKNQAKSLEEVRIGSSLGFPDEIGLEELIKDLPWSDFHHLKDLDICCRRNGDNTGIESVSSGQAAPSKSLTAAKGYGVKSVSISVYYPDAIQFSPSVNMKSERQIYRDLARCVAQLIDKSAIPGGPENWLHILQPASNPCEDPRASAHETTLKQAFIAEINGCLGMVN